MSKKLIFSSFMFCLSLTAEFSQAANISCEKLLSPWSPAVTADRILSPLFAKDYETSSGKPLYRMTENWSWPSHPSMAPGVRRKENRSATFNGVSFKIVPIPITIQLQTPAGVGRGPYKLIVESPDFAAQKDISAHLPKGIVIDEYSQLVVVGDQLILFSNSGNFVNTSVTAIRVSEKLKRISTKLIGYLPQRPYDLGAVISVGKYAFELNRDIGRITAYQFTNQGIQSVRLATLRRLQDVGADLHSATAQADYPDEIKFRIPTNLEIMIFTLSKN